MRRQPVAAAMKPTTPRLQSMDVEEAVDEDVEAKVARELVDDLLAKVDAEYPDGERQRSAEPRVPRFPPTPTCLLPSVLHGDVEFGRPSC